MNQIQVIYITVEGISSTVFDSQVYAITNEIRKRGISIKLFIGQKYNAKISISKFIKLFFNKKTSFFFIKKLNYSLIARKINRKLPQNVPLILHCRNIEASYIGVLIKKQRKNTEVIYDVRGHVESEKDFFNEHDRKIIFEELNTELFTSDIFFSFVSHKLYKEYNKLYPIDLKKIIFCNSAYNDKIFKLNKQFVSNFDEKIKILFIGGNQAYQNINSISEYFNNQKNCQLYIVTKNAFKDSQKYKNIVFHSNLSQKEISKLADSIDYGIIFRDDEIFNQVSTPTKITEYWGKGLKVIAIKSAGSYTDEIINNPKLGYFINDLHNFKNIQLSKLDYNAKAYIENYVRQKYSMSTNIKKYINFYEKIYTRFK